jgi:hypothetical protein
MNVIEHCKGWIEDALEYSGGTHDFEDIVEGIKAGRMQLWPSERGCIVTEILTYPKKKIINIFLGGGEIDQLAQMHDDVIQFAKGQGCTAATISGRKGWERAFKQYGWTPLHVTLIKEFD